MTQEELLGFWFADGPERFRKAWFTRDSAFDATCGQFAEAWEAARTGALDHWADIPLGALALCILLDQLSRNLRRNSPDAFVADAQARCIARRAVARGFDRELTPTQRMFLYMPFMHSEDPRDQDEAVRLFEGLERAAGTPVPDDALKAAHSHRDMIRRFGRFPFRNAVLQRASTAEETAWLAAQGDKLPLVDRI